MLAAATEPLHTYITLATIQAPAAHAVLWRSPLPSDGQAWMSWVIRKKIVVPTCQNKLCYATARRLTPRLCAVPQLTLPANWTLVMHQSQPYWVYESGSLLAKVSVMPGCCLKKLNEAFTLWRHGDEVKRQTSLYQTLSGEQHGVLASVRSLSLDTSGMIGLTRSPQLKPTWAQCDVSFATKCDVTSIDIII